MIGKRSISVSSRRLAKTTSGIEMARPRISSSVLPLAAAATAITLSRLITRSAIRIVLDGRPEAGDNCAVPVGLLLLGHQQLHRDPQQQRRAGELEVGQAQQLDRDDGQRDPHDDRRAAAPGDGALLLCGPAARGPPARSPPRCRPTARC